jgi:hypothetical protein
MPVTYPAATLASILADARLYLNEASAAQWADTTINAMANAEYRFLLTEAERLTGTRFAATQTISLVANVAEYDLNGFGTLTAQAPAESIVAVTDTRSGLPVPILPYGHADPAGVGLSCYILNNKIGFAPTPGDNAAGAIEVLHIVQQPVMDSSNAMLLPVKYRDLLALGAALRCNALRSIVSAPDLRMRYERALDQFAKTIGARERQDGPTMQLGEAGPGMAGWSRRNWK